MPLNFDLIKKTENKKPISWKAGESERKQRWNKKLLIIFFENKIGSSSLKCFNYEISQKEIVDKKQFKNQLSDNVWRFLLVAPEKIILLCTQKN